MKKVFQLFVEAIVIFIVTCSISSADEFSKPATTFNRAQVVEWISESMVAVGRWDGTITIFREPKSSSEYGMVITNALVTPSFKGVEMLYSINDEIIISSNDQYSIAVWLKGDKGFGLKEIIPYSNTFGIANSATTIGNKSRIITVGHANGYLSIWGLKASKLNFLRSVDLRTPSAPSNPWKLHNIRGVVAITNKSVIAGSEDGDLTIVDVDLGIVKFRKRYNPIAKRGINSLAISGKYLLLANCSVGSEDKNTWLYEVNENSIKLLSSTNLISDKDRPQSFNFEVELHTDDGITRFFASTEEGLLWGGKIVNGILSVEGTTKVSVEGAAALDVANDSENIVAVAHAIRLFSLAN